jgi:hypothetical protein
LYNRVKGFSDKNLDQMIDSYWDFITHHKLDYVNLEDSFIKYENGKLIVDLDDLNSRNVFDLKYKFLQVLNNLKNQDNRIYSDND